MKRPSAVEPSELRWRPEQWATAETVYTGFFGNAANLDGMNPEPLVSADVTYSGAFDATHFYIVAGGYLLEITL